VVIGKRPLTQDVQSGKIEHGFVRVSNPRRAKKMRVRDTKALA
jgi:hypothetical protein